MFRGIESRARYCFMLALLATLMFSSATPQYAAWVTSHAQETPSYDVYNLTYVDVAMITYVNNVSEGYFETPINYTEPHYTQVVRVFRVGGNVTVNTSEDKTSFTIPINNNSRGYVVLNVTLIRESRKEMNIVAQALYLGNVFLYDYPYPEEVVGKYVLQPNEKVVEVVVPLFEEWMRSKLYANISLGEVSKTYLAVWAANYVYGGYLIKYNASAIPRSLEEVLERREGDCDDMSRILLSLLWYYGVPAKIQYGYVYLKFDYVTDVYGSLTRFINAGPHAYVVVYVPTVGWVSVDLLAWARLYYPTLITGESTYSNVTSEDLEEVERFYTSFKYLELIEIHESSKLPEDLMRDLISEDLFSRLERMFSETPQETNTTTTATSPLTETTTTTPSTSVSHEKTTKAVIPTALFEVLTIIALVAGATILILSLIILKSGSRLKQ